MVDGRCESAHGSGALRWRLSDLEDDVEGGAGVDGSAAASGGLVANLFGGVDGGFVEAVAESAENAQDFDFAGSAKDDLEQDLAFDAQRARFGSVGRLGFEENFGREKR